MIVQMYILLLFMLDCDFLFGFVFLDLLGLIIIMLLLIIFLIFDIMQYYCDVIVCVKKEVFLVINYWQ